MEFDEQIVTPNSWIERLKKIVGGIKRNVSIAIVKTLD